MRAVFALLAAFAAASTLLAAAPAAAQLAGPTPVGPVAISDARPKHAAAAAATARAAAAAAAEPAASCPDAARYGMMDQPGRYSPDFPVSTASMHRLATARARACMPAWHASCWHTCRAACMYACRQHTALPLAAVLTSAAAPTVASQKGRDSEADDLNFMKLTQADQARSVADADKVRAGMEHIPWDKGCNC